MIIRFGCLEIHSHQIGGTSLKMDLAKVERSKEGWKPSDVWFSNNLIDKPYALELSDAKPHVAIAEKEITESSCSIPQSEPQTVDHLRQPCLNYIHQPLVHLFPPVSRG
jgi:hypothetical protein